MCVCGRSVSETYEEKEEEEEEKKSPAHIMYNNKNLRVTATNRLPAPGLAMS